MAEIIQIHVGQAGVQIANACWELYCLEHGINADGTMYEIPSDSTFTNFFDFKTANKVVPRAIMVDAEPTVIDQIRTGPFGCLYSPSSLITGKEDSGSNYARGYFTMGAELIDITMEGIRNAAESCSNLRGFVLFRAIGGGTGSGLGNLIAEHLLDTYEKLNKFEFIIFPSPSLSPLIVEPYNALLATHFGMDSIDCTFIIDNEALYDVCSKKLNIHAPKYKNLNRIIGQTASNFTTSQRFSGSSNVSLTEFQVNLVPYPRIHYPMLSYAPFVPGTGSGYTRLSTEQITTACFDPSNQLIRCNPVEGKYMSSVLLYRGDVSTCEIHSSISRLRNSSSIRFADWSPMGFKVGTNSEPPCSVPGGGLGNTDKSLVVLSNNTIIQKAWCRLIDKYNRLYSKRAFVHHYISEGLEESSFEEASEDIRTLISDYKEVYSGDNRQNVANNGVFKKRQNKSEKSRTPYKEFAQEGFHNEENNISREHKSRDRKLPDEKLFEEEWHSEKLHNEKSRGKRFRHEESGDDNGKNQPGVHRKYISEYKGVSENTDSEGEGLPSQTPSVISVKTQIYVKHPINNRDQVSSSKHGNDQNATPLSQSRSLQQDYDQNNLSQSRLKKDSSNSLLKPQESFEQGSYEIIGWALPIRDEDENDENEKKPAILEKSKSYESVTSIRESSKRRSKSHEPKVSEGTFSYSKIETVKSMESFVLNSPDTRTMKLASPRRSADEEILSETLIAKERFNKLKGSKDKQNYSETPQDYIINEDDKPLRSYQNSTNDQFNQPVFSQEINISKNTTSKYMSDEKSRERELPDEKLSDGELRSEKLRSEKLRNEKLRSEKLRSEKLRNEKLRNEKSRDKRFRRESGDGSRYLPDKNHPREDREYIFECEEFYNSENLEEGEGLPSRNPSMTSVKTEIFVMRPIKNHAQVKPQESYDGIGWALPIRDEEDENDENEKKQAKLEKSRSYESVNSLRGRCKKRSKSHEPKVSEGTFRHSQRNSYTPNVQDCRQMESFVPNSPDEERVLKLPPPRSEGQEILGEALSAKERFCKSKCYRVRQNYTCTPQDYNILYCERPSCSYQNSTNDEYNQPVSPYPTSSSIPQTTNHPPMWMRPSPGMFNYETQDYSGYPNNNSLGCRQQKQKSSKKAACFCDRELGGRFDSSYTGETSPECLGNDNFICYQDEMLSCPNEINYNPYPQCSAVATPYMHSDTPVSQPNEVIGLNNEIVLPRPPGNNIDRR